MNHYVYRIDRPATGEWYIGIRSCKCAPIEDVRYRGSGVRVLLIPSRELVKKVLVQVQTREEAARIEAALVGAEQLADPLCLNLCEGGSRGPVGAKRSEETRRKMRENHTKQMADPVKRARWLAAHAASRTAETRAKISETLTGRKLSDDHVRKIGDANRGQVRTPDQRKNISDGNRRGWSLERRCAHAQLMRDRWASGEHTGRKKR